ncbi:MAG: hypothetical protein MUC92_13585 [Fimbriimonadaceae bacterium]|jgi:division/cell wall cluster transcriptional repressor MraZ|nr:hypothetical protein [Fimbriimonadaceae bacterium]
MSQFAAPVNLRPLTGEEFATVDEKGRLLFSKKKRERLGDVFALGVSELGCLVGFPLDIWNRMTTELLNYSSMNNGRLAYSMWLGRSIEDEVRCDGQGRILIPMNLREKVGLTAGKHDVVISGAIDRVLIFKASEYEKFLADPAAYNRAERDRVAAMYQEMLSGG